MYGYRELSEQEQEPKLETYSDIYRQNRKISDKSRKKHKTHSDLITIKGANKEQQNKQHA